MFKKMKDLQGVAVDMAHFEFVHVNLDELDIWELGCQIIKVRSDGTAGATPLSGEVHNHLKAAGKALLSLQLNLDASAAEEQV